MVKLKGLLGRREGTGTGTGLSSGGEVGEGGEGDDEWLRNQRRGEGFRGVVVGGRSKNGGGS